MNWFLNVSRSSSIILECCFKIEHFSYAPIYKTGSYSVIGCVRLCDPMDCCKPALPVLHYGQ